ncbi:unnamed protein product [Staurois parvus]|uniref:Uncharacterized protein n=1 Tax=Staurois parvus TaxID=386267 RepID=A0ABN9BVM3_9NEOB|nr:unnamed protein product [Staurois parvus]
MQGPGRADIVNAGSGESGYSECRGSGKRYSECRVRGDLIYSECRIQGEPDIVNEGSGGYHI